MNPARGSTSKNRAQPGTRGYTLVELLVAVAIGAIVVVLTVGVLIGIDRDQARRTLTAQLQGNARDALGWLETDLRLASLGSGSGIIWTASAGTGTIRRPAVQIFRAVPGGGLLDVKPGTSAVLMVQALSDPPPVASKLEQATSTVTINLTATPALTAGTPVLMGDYSQASWGVLASDAASATIALADTTNNVFPGYQVQRLPAGSAIRRARARLYYVDTSNELVRLTLTVPRAPTSATEIANREVLGVGYENLQIDCSLDPTVVGAAFGSCPAALATGDAVSTESTTAFGSFGTGQGPVFTADAANPVRFVRTVTVNAVVRSRIPIADGNGDEPIGVNGVTFGTSGDGYLRRAYAISAAVRNTSLGAF